MPLEIRGHTCNITLRPEHSATQCAAQSATQVLHKSPFHRIIQIIPQSILLVCSRLL